MEFNGREQIYHSPLLSVHWAKLYHRQSPSCTNAEKGKYAIQKLASNVLESDVTYMELLDPNIYGIQEDPCCVAAVIDQVGGWLS